MSFDRQVYHNYQMAATDQIQILLEEQETMVCTIRKVTAHSAYTALDNCYKMIRFVHITVFADALFRSFELCITLKQKAVPKVIRVNNARPEVEKTDSNVVKQHDTFSFVRQESKKLHQLE
jgi:translation initiation factor 2 alpha subunit (eIF-2alpha)